MLHLKSQHIKFLAEKIPLIVLILWNNLKSKSFSLFGGGWDISTLFYQLALRLGLWWWCIFPPSKPDVILWEGERGGGAKYWKKGSVAYMFCIPGKRDMFPEFPEVCKLQCITSYLTLFIICDIRVWRFQQVFPRITIKRCAKCISHLLAHCFWRAGKSWSIFFHLALKEEAIVPIMQSAGAGKKIPALDSLNSVFHIARESKYGILFVMSLFWKDSWVKSHEHYLPAPCSCAVLPYSCSGPYRKGI